MLFENTRSDIISIYCAHAFKHINNLENNVLIIYSLQLHAQRWTYLHVRGLADAFVQFELVLHTVWWRWLPWKVPTSTSEAVWGSVSCPRTLWHADQGNQTSELPITRCWLYPCGHSRPHLVLGCDKIRKEALNNEQGKKLFHSSVKCAYLMAGIGSQTIVVVLNLHFDVIGGALLSSAQALHVKTEERPCETDAQQPTHTEHCQRLQRLKNSRDPSQCSPCPSTSPSAPASSGQIWSHLYSRRCSWGRQTTSVSSGLDTESSNNIT